MNRKQLIKTTLIVSLFFLALGGWLLHLRIHPLAKNTSNLFPYLSGILSVFCLPLLFSFRRTIVLAYILNGFSAIFGTILMAHFSIVHFQGAFTAENFFLTTTFADITVLWGKFALGKALFDLEHLKSDTDVAAKGHFFRYPNMGWWWVHLVALSAVYYLGNALLK